MTRLPPDDQSPPPTPPSEVEALVAAGEPGAGNPVTVSAVFWTAVTEPDGPDLSILSIVVTPESWPGWGDFRRAAAYLPGYGMGSTVTPSVDDPDVVYVRFLRDTGEAVGAPADAVPAGDILIATLVRRPRLGGWRIHALGDYVRPEHVPHDRRPRA
jgi:hypothetical protein